MWYHIVRLLFFMGYCKRKPYSINMNLNSHLWGLKPRWRSYICSAKWTRLTSYSPCSEYLFLISLSYDLSGLQFSSKDVSSRSNYILDVLVGFRVWYGLVSSDGYCCGQWDYVGFLLASYVSSVTVILQ
jgi:hypothetical protein